jgi:hypothetical protein
MGHAWHWLIMNGLYKDLLAATVALAVTRIAALRPMRRLRRIEDLLDTDSPGGLRDVVRALTGDTGRKDGDEEERLDVGPHGVAPPMPPHHIR